MLDETHVVILDNASFRKGSETARLIAETGASLLFLPPYASKLHLRRSSLTVKVPTT